MDSIVARGDGFAVGQAIGRRGGRSVRDAAFHTAQFQALKPWLGSDRLEALKAATVREFPRLFREIEGIAHGAGLPILRDGHEAGNDGFTLATVVFEITSRAVDWTVSHGPDRAAVASGSHRL